MTHVKKGQQGFTLIELMIVVAIIGILAAIAIPAYQDYTVRAKVTEGISAVNAARASVSEYWSTTNTFPADNDEAGLATNTDYATAKVKSLTVEDGDITVVFEDLGGDMDGDETLVYAPNESAGGQLEWNCTGGTLQQKYRPANCRGGGGGS